MATINFSQSIKDEPDKVKLKIFDKGFYVSIGLVFFTLLVWVGLIFYSSVLSKKTEEMNESIKAENNKIKNQTSVRIADFQNRLDKIKVHSESLYSPNNSLKSVEKLILPEIVLSSLNYSSDKKQVILLATTNGGFKSVARQLVALKDDIYLKNVVLNSLTKSEKKLDFSITADVYFSETK